MWKDLVKVAILGTDRTDLPVSLLAELQVAGIDTNESPEVILAEGLAYHYLLAKGARNLPVFEGEVPSVVEEESTFVCHPKSSRHLRLILDGTFADALPEFIRLLKEHKKSFPPESLPDLLDRCVAKADLWNELQPAIGARGRWLIRQNPDWRSLFPETSEAAWEKADVKDRPGILKQWRRSKPREALQQLEKIWDDLDYTQKAVYLKTMYDGLADTDEAFLERGLDEGRKPVRQEAVQLLSLLQNSDLQKRLFGMASQYLKIENGRLEAHPPAELTKAAIRNGIEKNTKDYPRSSQGLGWLLQMIERIPPSRWEKHFEIEPEAFLKMAKQLDKNKNFIRALSKAAILHQDTSWLTAVARHWSTEQDEIMWKSALGKQVLKNLPPSTANALAIHELERNENLLDEHGLAHQILTLGAHPWEDRLALLLIKGFQNWLAGTSAFSWNKEHYRRLFWIASYRCAPELIPKFKIGWHTQSRIWNAWQNDVEQFMRVLLFRREMKSALQFN